MVEKATKVVQAILKWSRLPMFMGEYIHTVDAKGRVIIPSSSEKIWEEFVITLGLDGCLLHTQIPNGRYLLKSLKHSGNKRCQATATIFYGGAAACQADKQGRILIPAKLREKLL